MDIESTGASDEFKSKNTLQKIWIMSAGVLMNFLLAIFIFAHLTYHKGVSEADPSTFIGEVMPEYPAEVLGLRTGDQIISINGIPMSNWEKMTKEIHSKPEEVIHISWQRNGKIINGSIKTVIATQQLPWNKNIVNGVIGIRPLFNHRYVSILEAFTNGYSQTYLWLEITYKTLTSLIMGEVSIKQMAGPIMIAKMAGETATTGGIYALLGLMGIISVNLGLINILPIPGLDGGHVFIAIIEGLIRREIPIKIKLGIQQVGMLLILILFFTIMINDIQRILQ